MPGWSRIWGDDVPKGKVTDFQGAVQAKDDETVVFSWFEYPDKATRDAANAKMMADPRMEAMGADMPFDGKRMIMGGFDSYRRRSAAGETAATPTAIVAPGPRSASRKTIARWPQEMAEKFRESGRDPGGRGAGATTCPTARSPITSAR